MSSCRSRGHRCLGAWVGNGLWHASSLPEAWLFQRGLSDLRGTQERILDTQISRQATTPFGRRHNLRQLTSYPAFRDLVPVSSYRTLLPYLAQPGGLSTAKVKVWEPTGGSSGGSKWIPWTTHLQSEFRRAVSVWIWHLFRRYPDLRGGRSYWQLTPKTELTPPHWLDGETTGFKNDGDYLGPLGRWLDRFVLLSAAAGPELWERTVAMLRAASDLRLISCWSPSFLLLLQEHFLEQLGAWEPATWWPRLQVISCWTQAASKAYHCRLQALFPGVAIQPKGLLATEAVTTIPLEDDFPLAYRSHFFEFRTSANEIIPAWELEVGQDVSVIVTTGSGFSRYETGDQVRVIGRLGQVPCLEFRGRQGVVDFVGEKLSLTLVDKLVRAIPGFAMLGFEERGYVLFVDTQHSLQERREQALGASLRLLQCYTYKDCITLGQLQPLRCFVVEGDALSQYSRVCVERFRQREGTVKPVAFHPAADWSRLLRGSFIP